MRLHVPDLRRQWAASVVNSESRWVGRPFIGSPPLGRVWDGTLGAQSRLQRTPADVKRGMVTKWQPVTVPSLGVRIPSSTPPSDLLSGTRSEAPGAVSQRRCDDPRGGG